jgi:hypothetical protein
MPANQVSIQPYIYKTGNAAISAANTSETSAATGGVALYTPTAAASGGQGARVTSIRVQATGTTTAGRLKFWRYDGSSVYYRLFDIAVSAVTVSGMLPGWSTNLLSGSGSNPITGDIACDILLLPAERLFISTYNAETFNACCDAIEYGGL